MTKARTMLVTGASKGIGRATVRRFFDAVDGPSELILLARQSAAFDDTMRELESENPHGRRAHRYDVDLADRQAVLEATAEVMRRHETVDVLVNNAGYTDPKPIQQIDFASFERTMAVNLYAPFTFVQEALRLGNTFQLIVNIASTAGLQGRPGWLTYSASKSAMITMSEVMKEELKIFGTRVCCISPGRCATDLRRTLAPDEDPSTIMQPEHVATVIEMLASDAGPFIDSQNLVVRM